MADRNITFSFTLKDDGTVALGQIEGALNKTDDAAKKSTASLGNFASGIVQGIGQAVGTRLFDILATSIQAVPGALVNAAAATIKYGGDLVTTAAKTGILAEAQQKLGFAGAAVSVGFGSIQTSIGAMQKGLIETPEKFDRIGLSAANLRKMKPEEQFQAIGEKIATIQDPAARSAAAVLLFGRSGIDVLPLLTSSMGDTMAQAERLGLVMSTEVAGAADDLGNKVGTLGAVWDGLTRNIGAAIVTSEPLHVLFSGLVEILGSFSKTVQDNQGSIRTWVDAGVVFAANALLLLVKASTYVIDAWTGLQVITLSLGARFEQLGIIAIGLFNAISEPTKAADHFKAALGALKDAQDRYTTSVSAEMQKNAERQRVAAGVVKQFEDLRNKVEANVGVTHRATKETTDYGGALKQSAEDLAKLLELEKKRQATLLMIQVSTAKLAQDEAKRIQPLLEGMEREHLARILLNSGLQINATLQKELGKEIDEVRRKSSEAMGGIGLLVSEVKIAGEESMKFWSRYDDIQEEIDANGGRLFGNQVNGWETIANTASDVAGVIGSIGGLLEALGVTADSELGQMVGALSGAADAASNLAAAIASGNPAAIVGASIQAAGAIVGLGRAIGDLFSSSDAEKAAEKAGRTYGTEFTEEMGQAIVDEAERLGISIENAILLNLSEVLDETGKEVEEFAVQVGNLMEAVADGSIPAREGIEEIGTVFTKAAEEGGAAMIAMILRARELGLEVPEIAEHVAAALDTAIEGLHRFVQGIDALDGEFGRMAENSAVIFMSTFDALVQERGWVGATMALEETFSILEEKLTEIGSDAALALTEPFQRFRNYLDNDVLRGALEATDGLTQVMHGLAEAGYLDAASFQAMQETAVDLFAHMVEGGMSSGDALRAMAPAIQEAIRASEMFGIPLDADMQKLKEMAEQNGITFRTDPMNAMVDLLEQIVVLMGGTLPDAARRTEEAFTDGANRAREEWERFRDQDYTPHYNPPPGGDGGPSTPAAGGAVVPPRPGGSPYVVNGSPFVVGEGGKTELIGPVEDLAVSIGRGLAAGLAGSGFGHVSVVLEGDAAGLFRLVSEGTRTGDVEIHRRAIVDRP